MIAYGGGQGSHKAARLSWMIALAIIMITWGACNNEAYNCAQFICAHQHKTEKVNPR